MQCNHSSIPLVLFFLFSFYVKDKRPIPPDKAFVILYFFVNLNLPTVKKTQKNRVCWHTGAIELVFLLTGSEPLVGFVHLKKKPHIHTVFSCGCELSKIRGMFSGGGCTLLNMSPLLHHPPTSNPVPFLLIFSSVIESKLFLSHKVQKSMFSFFYMQFFSNFTKTKQTWHRRHRTPPRCNFLLHQYFLTH